MLVFGCSFTLRAQDRKGEESKKELTEKEYQVNAITYLDISTFHFRILGGSQNISDESMRDTVIPGAVNQAIVFSFIVYLDIISKNSTLDFDDSARKRFFTSCRELTKGLTADQVTVAIKKYFQTNGSGKIGSPYLSNYSVESLNKDVVNYLKSIHDKGLK